MRTLLISRENAIFELYKAALNGAISQSEFFKAKEILRWTVRYEVDSENMKRLENDGSESI